MSGMQFKVSEDADEEAETTEAVSPGSTQCCPEWEP